jgi:hypothetical protein
MTTARKLLDVGQNTVNGALCAVYLLLDDSGNDRYLVAFDGESEILSDYGDVLMHVADRGYQL